VSIVIAVYTIGSKFLIIIYIRKCSAGPFVLATACVGWWYKCSAVKQCTLPICGLPSLC